MKIVFTRRRCALSLLLEMFFMWKAMMFSVWPVRTASAALRTRKQTVRYQSSDTIRETERGRAREKTCVAFAERMNEWGPGEKHQGKTKVSAGATIAHTRTHTIFDIPLSTKWQYKSSLCHQVRKIDIEIYNKKTSPHFCKKVIFGWRGRNWKQKILYLL